MLCCASQFQLLTKFAEGFDDDLKHPKVHFGSIVISLPREGRGRGEGGYCAHLCQVLPITNVCDHTV